MNRRNYKSFEEILRDFINNSFNNSFEFKAPSSDEMKKSRKLRSDINFILITNHLFSTKKTKETWKAVRNLKSELQRKLNECVDKEEFEEAAKLRDQIKDLELNNTKINNLKKELELVIKEQNFERAIEIREELKKIN
jgi:excinuclease UvrABC helicase subunit UvrB